METTKHRVVFHFLRSLNLTINFLQKPETTYVAVVSLDQFLVSVISVKQRKGVRTTETENRVLGREH